MLESTITVRVTVKPNADRWDVALARVNDDKVFPITNLYHRTASEVYTKFGIKVPMPDTPVEDRLEQAKSVLRDRLAALGTSTVVSTASVQDTLLDALNQLGYEQEQTDEL